MSQIEFTILDETEFLDRSTPDKAIPSMLVTYQTADGRVDSIALQKQGYDKTTRNKAVADRIKKTPPRSFERVRV